MPHSKAATAATLADRARSPAPPLPSSLLPLLLLLLLPLSAGCILPGPPPGPVLLSEVSSPDGVVRWYLEPEGALVEEKPGAAAGSGIRVPLPSESEPLRTGLRFGLLDADLAGRVFDLPSPAVLVTGVPLGTPAWLAGLRRGDRLLEIDGSPPGDPAAVAARLREAPAGSEVVLGVVGRDGAHRFAFPLAEDVEARSGTDLGILYGSEGWRGRWDSWGLAGLLWASTRVWWETEEREPLRWAWAETGWFLVSYIESPRSGNWLRVLWVIPVPLP